MSRGDTSRSVRVRPGPAVGSEDQMLTEAQGYWTAREKSGLRLSYLLRRLFDSEAHKKDGFAQFGQWAEARFPGMTADLARQHSRAGAVLIELEAAGRMAWSGESAPDRGVPSVRGARALASVLFKQGEDEMLSVYDTAMLLAGGAPCSERHVKKAVEARRVPRDRPDERPDREPVEYEEVAEASEEHDTLMQVLGELDDVLQRIGVLVDDEHAAIIDVLTNREHKLLSLLEQHAGLAADLQAAYEAFRAFAAKVGK